MRMLVEFVGLLLKRVMAGGVGAVESILNPDVVKLVVLPALSVDVIFSFDPVVFTVGIVQV